MERYRRDFSGSQQLDLLVADRFFIICFIVIWYTFDLPTRNPASPSASISWYAFSIPFCQIVSCILRILHFVYWAQLCYLSFLWKCLIYLYIFGLVLSNLKSTLEILLDPGDFVFFYSLHTLLLLFCVLTRWR